MAHIRNFQPAVSRLFDDRSRLLFGQFVALAEYYETAEFQLSGFNRTHVIEGGAGTFRPLQLPLG
jgi:hypothetical protein